jgi:hypothetical protein
MNSLELEQAYFQNNITYQMKFFHLVKFSNQEEKEWAINSIIYDEFL